jgi:hypothetical protein
MGASNPSDFWMNWFRKQLGNSNPYVGVAAQAAEKAINSGKTMPEAVRAGQAAAARTHFPVTFGRRGERLWDEKFNLNPEIFPPKVKPDPYVRPPDIVAGAVQFAVDTLDGLLGTGVAGDKNDKPGVGYGEQAVNILLFTLPADKLFAEVFRGAKSLLAPEARAATTAAERAFLKDVDEGFKAFIENSGKPVAERLARGNLGEKLAADALAFDGHTILSYKPSIMGTNQRGIDILSMKDGIVYFVDNKALTSSGNISSVSALTTNFAVNKAAALRELKMAISGKISAGERAVLQGAVDAIEQGKFVRVVTNANVAIDNRLKIGITANLQAHGIQFINVMGSTATRSGQQEATEAIKLAAALAAEKAGQPVNSLAIGLATQQAAMAAQLTNQQIAQQTSQQILNQARWTAQQVVQTALGQQALQVTRNTQQAVQAAQIAQQNFQTAQAAQQAIQAAQSVQQQGMQQAAQQQGAQQTLLQGIMQQAALQANQQLAMQAVQQQGTAQAAAQQQAAALAASGYQQAILQQAIQQAIWQAQQAAQAAANATRGCPQTPGVVTICTWPSNPPR